MTNRLLSFIAAGTLVFSFNQASAQSWETIDAEKNVSTDTITRKGLTLIFINQDKGFNPATGESMIETFFKVYPQQIKTFNKSSTRKVIFIIDPSFEGVAAAASGIIRFNPGWMRNNPGDIDVVTHEVMHLVQSYPSGAGPGWVIEGIADYVRYAMGVDNAGAGWALPEFHPTQNYTDAYRVTARFFLWIEKNKKKGFVASLDNAMRTKSYTDDFWKKKFGKTVDELWSEYAQSSQISM